MKRTAQYPMARLLLPLFVVIVVAGCTGDDGRIPVYPVKGALIFQGKPAAGALVTLHALDAKHPAALQPNGKVQDDGSFQITTYEAGDGAPAGSYAVTVFWPEPPASPVEAPDSGPDRFRGRYLIPDKSPWKIKITEQPNELPPFELK